VCRLRSDAGGFVGAALEFDAEDHFAAPLKRRGFIQPRGAAVEDAEASRTAHFVALKARKSQPISWTSSGRCPALWAASTRVTTPRRRARAQMWAAG